MNVRKPAIEGVSIVLVGKFNPAVFHPSWFAQQGLLRPSEAETAEDVVVLQHVATFKMDWLNVFVDMQRFQLHTTQMDYYPVIRDLAMGTFALMPETPIYMLGINMHSHVRVDSEGDWHKIGNTLAPKDPWGGILESPGMKSVSIQGIRPDERDDGDIVGGITVQVEPSVKFPLAVFFSVNDHFQIKDPQHPSISAGTIMEVLAANWNSSLDRSRTIRDRLLEKVVSDGK